MKKLLYIPFVLFAVVHADISLDQIETMVQKIRMKRPGVDLKTLEKTKDPFVHIAKEDNKTVIVAPNHVEEKKFSLHGIMNGRAFINEEWLKEGDKIQGFVVKYIGKRGVVLQSGNQIKTLFLHKGKENIITIQEREE